MLYCDLLITCVSGDRTLWLVCFLPEQWTRIIVGTVLIVRNNNSICITCHMVIGPFPHHYICCWSYCWLCYLCSMYSLFARFFVCIKQHNTTTKIFKLILHLQRLCSMHFFNVQYSKINGIICGERYSILYCQ